jgi:hypothetical protein
MRNGQLLREMIGPEDVINGMDVRLAWGSDEDLLIVPRSGDRTVKMWIEFAQKAAANQETVNRLIWLFRPSVVGIVLI